MQIRGRLTLLFLMLASGILAAVLFAVFWMFRQNMTEAFYQGLASKAEVTVKTILPEIDKVQISDATWIAPDENTGLPYQDNISIFNSNYERVFSVHSDAVPVPVNDLANIYTRSRYKFEHFNLCAFGMSATGPNGSAYIVVAEGSPDSTAISKLRNVLIISFFLGIILVSATGWYYSGKALEPMSAIVREVEHIQPSDLSRRLQPGKNQDEIRKLAVTFNHLLERVERAFMMQKMFVSNVSHELKNPLTVIRSQLDVALQRDRSADEYKSALESVLDDIRDLSETEQRLLHLARVYTNPQHIEMAATRLDELIWQAADQLHKQFPGATATIHFSEMPEHGEDLEISANEPLLRMALVNIMNNACKYSPDNQVTLNAFFQTDGKHTLEIADNGPGIPDDEKLLVFEPFYRSPRHLLSVKGTGIGLSLVKSILDLHNVSVCIKDRNEGGSVFVLLFN